MITPSDIHSAGGGDLSALRRMRDHWLDLAAGRVSNPLLPVEDAIPQLELLAELAAGSGEPEDQRMLIVAYQVRIAALERVQAAFERLANEANAASDVEALDTWSRVVAAIEHRRHHYAAKREELVGHALTAGSVETAALMMIGLSRQADEGDESAAVDLQSVMDALTAERAAAIQTEVKKIEREATR